MTTTVLHLLGSANVDGTGIARIVCLLARDTSRYCHHACFLHGSGPLVDYLQQHGVISCNTINLDRPWRSVWQLWRLLRQLQPAIVHQHAGGPRLTRLIHWCSSASIVVHVHSTVDEHSMQVVAPVLSPVADAIIAAARSIARQIDDGRCRVVHAAVEVPAALPARDQQQLIVGAAGRLTTVKAYAALIRAFTQIAPLFPQARLQLCGDGPLQRDLQQQIRQTGCADRIDLLLWCDDYPQRAQQWDIFVQPSLAEGLPISLLEAMAAGLPVIAADVGGMAEAVTDGESGLLVTPADESALAAALSALLSDAPLRARMGNAGRQCILRQFSPERMRGEVDALYVSLPGLQP